MRKAIGCVLKSAVDEDHPRKDEAKAILAARGARYVGIASHPGGPGSRSGPHLYFNEPRTGSTAVLHMDDVSHESVRAKLNDVTRRFGLGDVYKSLRKSVALDLDGTLASYGGPGGEIGPPLPGAVELARELSDRGAEVVVFTARASGDDDARAAVERWLSEHGFPKGVRVVSEKPREAKVFLDDRAFAFEPSLLSDPVALAEALLAFRPYWSSADPLPPPRQAPGGFAGFEPAVAKSQVEGYGRKNPKTGAWERVSGYYKADHWKPVTGPASSTHTFPGGWMEDEDGRKWWVKGGKDDEHLKVEWLANRLYRHVGVKVPKGRLVTVGGKLRYASEALDGASPAKLDDARAGFDAHLGFAADAWLANHDAVGMTQGGAASNMLTTKDRLWRIDHGGALHRRAGGGSKVFGPEVKEVESMKDPSVNEASARVFTPLPDNAAASFFTESAQRIGAEAVAAVSPEKIRRAVGEARLDPRLATALYRNLLYRQRDVAKRMLPSDHPANTAPPLTKSSYDDALAEARALFGVCRCGEPLVRPATAEGGWGLVCPSCGETSPALDDGPKSRDIEKSGPGVDAGFIMPDGRARRAPEGMDHQDFAEKMGHKGPDNVKSALHAGLVRYSRSRASQFDVRPSVYVHFLHGHEGARGNAEAFIDRHPGAASYHIDTERRDGTLATSVRKDSHAEALAHIRSLSALPPPPRPEAPRLEKSHVKGYWRREGDKLIWVRDHDDSRAKADGPSRLADPAQRLAEMERDRKEERESFWKKKVARIARLNRLPGVRVWRRGDSSAAEDIVGPPLARWRRPNDWSSHAEGQHPFLEGPPLEKTPGYHQAAGVIAVEKDGRVWLVEPRGHWGGYEATWPKGTVEGPLSLQQTAQKEVAEEAGLKVRIVGHLGDYHRTSSNTRYYVGVREGGHPGDADAETYATKLVPHDHLDKFLNHPQDREIAGHLRELMAQAAERGDGDLHLGLKRVLGGGEWRPKMPASPRPAFNIEEATKPKVEGASLKGFSIGGKRATTTPQPAESSPPRKGIVESAKERIARLFLFGKSEREPIGAIYKNRRLHFRTEFQGLPISVENRRGSWRHWNDPLTGRSGHTKMNHGYGYIRGTEGTDGDSVDCFLGPDPDAPTAYIVRQVNPETGEYDEDKVMLGFGSEVEAREAYLEHYDDPRYYGGLVPMPVSLLRQRLKETRERPGPVRSGEDMAPAALTISRRA